MPGFDLIDRYTMKARVFPAVIALAPALALAVGLVSWDRISISDIIPSLFCAVFLFPLADVSRRLGKRVENDLVQSWGGMPSVHLLRFRDSTLDDRTEARCLQFIGGRIGENPPKREDETEAPEACDEFYGRCCLWLREHTRNRERFGILFEENVGYGFRRNLLGLRWVGVAIGTFIGVLSALSLMFSIPVFSDKIGVLRASALIAFSAIHILYLLIFVTRSSVYQSALLYARQLILSYEPLLAEKK